MTPPRDQDANSDDFAPVIPLRRRAQEEDRAPTAEHHPDPGSLNVFDPAGTDPPSLVESPSLWEGPAVELPRRERPQHPPSPRPQERLEPPRGRELLPPPLRARQRGLLTAAALAALVGTVGGLTLHPGSGRVSGSRAAGPAASSPRLTPGSSASALSARRGSSTVSHARATTETAHREQRLRVARTARLRRQAPLPRAAAVQASSPASNVPSEPAPGAPAVSIARNSAHDHQAGAGAGPYSCAFPPCS